MHRPRIVSSCRRFLVGAIALLTACSPSRHANDEEGTLSRGDLTSADQRAPSGAFPEAADRRILYQDLTATIRKYHVFSEQTAINLGINWDSALARLEPAFVEAQDEAALREAIQRLANSLHDYHLGYQSGKPTERLRLGLTLEGQWNADRAEYRVKSVDDPALRQQIAPGDFLVSINDVLAEQLPRVNLDRSKANNLPAIAWGISRYLTQRDANVSRTRPGDIDRWRLRRLGAATPYQIDLRWARGADGQQSDTENHTSDPDYLPARCHPYQNGMDSYREDREYNLPAERAGGYRITGYGTRFCLYTAEALPYRYYPIVRHFSFFYYSDFPRDQTHDKKLNTEATYRVAADYFALSRLLRERPETRGLIVDLRDNGGGNDPEWFLDWYAPAPYEDQYIGVRAAPDWQEPSFTARVINIDDDWLKWYRGAAAGVAQGSWLKRPCKCLRPDCSGANRYTPARGLLKVPVALLTSRGCASSCAHFAHIFDENDFGPLIGEPPPATETNQSYTHAVRTRSGLELGQIKLALNVSLSGKTGKALEGVLPDMDYPVPPRFDNRDSWDAALVAAALRSFKEYRFPKHVTPLGP